MDLPETTMLNFFNKVLLSLTELTLIDNRCAIDKLIELCKSKVFGGTLGDYEAAISKCKEAGLITIKDKDVAISTLGLKFLNANKMRYFEITEAQKHIIIERIVFKGSWSNHARELFEHFSANPITAVYEASIIEDAFTNELEFAVNLFTFIGILENDNGIVKVNKKYSQLVYELTADSKAIAEQQMEQLIMENRKLGNQAEIAIVEFEKQRLTNLGKTYQADLVKRISTTNSAAGYDIESFDGDNEDIFPNRFIEVKATTGSDIRFYWTINERNVAKTNAEKYWIYVLTDFREDTFNNVCPIKIKDPENALPSHKSLSIEVNKYLINAIEEVLLVEVVSNDLKWYVLD